jgi:hypothetical protein
MGDSGGIANFFRTLMQAQEIRTWSTNNLSTRLDDQTENDDD